MLKDVEGVLTLREEQTTRAALHSHSQKMMELTEVFHEKFLLLGGDSVPKEIQTGSSQHNIIHIEEQVNCVRPATVVPRTRSLLQSIW